MLFDFDSAVEKSRLSDAVISCTAKWAAPEVLQQNRRKIGVASDVYTLGGLLLYLLFRRVPEVKDRRNRAVWDAEFPDSVLAGTSPEIRRMVTELLRKTLSANPEKRYASCAELLAQIEPFLDIVFFIPDVRNLQKRTRSRSKQILQKPAQNHGIPDGDTKRTERRNGADSLAQGTGMLDPALFKRL